MKRPDIADHFPKSTDLKMAMRTFRQAPELFSYIQELDQYIDQLEAEEIKKKIKYKNWAPSELSSEQYNQQLDDECAEWYERLEPGLQVPTEIIKNFARHWHQLQTNRLTASKFPLPSINPRHWHQIQSTPPTDH